MVAHDDGMHPIIERRVDFVGHEDLAARGDRADAGGQVTTVPVAV